MAALAFLKLVFLAFAVAVAEGEDSCMIQEDHSSAQATAIQFLQTRLAVDEEDRHEARPSIVPLLPIYYFHIPKAGGTQFGDSILLFEHLCWNLTHQDIEYLQNSMSCYGNDFCAWSQDFENMCSVADMRRFGIRFRDHSGIGSFYGQWAKGHGLTMLRQPEQRILSAFRYHYHSWPFSIFGRGPEDELEYAKSVAGCAVKMLTRDGTSIGLGHSSTVCGDLAPATDGETKQAIERLAEGFHYVGIVEEWSKSMCLFHAMFGGTCQAQEFSSGNSNSNSSAYDTSVLQGWRDEQDGKLYKEGLILFQTSLHRYRITDESVRRCELEAKR